MIFVCTFFQLQLKERKPESAKKIGAPLINIFMFFPHSHTHSVHYQTDTHLSSQQTYINGIPLEDSELQEELQFDLPLLEELLHLGLCLVQLLQHALNVVDGAVVRCLVAGDSRVPGKETHN